jgi:hypothetical protein
VLVEKVVFPVMEDCPVGIVHPVGWRQKMVLWPVGTMLGFADISLECFCGLFDWRLHGL